MKTDVMKFKVWPVFKHNSLRKLCSKVKWKSNNVLNGCLISYNINNKSHYHHSIKQTSHKNIKKYQLGDKLTQYQTLWTNIMRIVWQTVRRIPSKKFWINNTILTMELRSFWHLMNYGSYCFFSVIFPWKAKIIFPLNFLWKFYSRLL